MEQLVTQYKVSDLSTNVSFLTNDHKELIVTAISQHWTIPEFKVKNFIGNAQITPYAKLKQYLLELNTRESAVESMEYESQKIVFEIEIHTEEMERTLSPAQKKLHQLEVIKLQRMQRKSQSRLKDAYDERDIYLKLIDEFNNSSEGYLEDGRRIMDIMTNSAETEKLEKEYWTLRLAKQTALDMIAYGRAGVGNMEAVGMLEPAQQIEVMELACDYFVRNEIRTNNILSYVNNSIQQLGVDAPTTKLSSQLYLGTKGKEDVPTV